MSEVELRKSLFATLHYLLKSKEDIELQIDDAKRVINLSCERSIEEGMLPISIENDAVWFKYLLGLLEQVKSDIGLVSQALSQLGVSGFSHLSSSDSQLYKSNLSQGDNTLDFSFKNER